MEIVWDLSEMFPSTTDPSIQKTIDGLIKTAEDFSAKYQGKIIGLSSIELLKCIEEFEAYHAKLCEINSFAALPFAANMTLLDTQSLDDKMKKTKAKLDKVMVFFKIEMTNLVYQKPGIIHEPILRNYRHFLERLKVGVPHQLSESEEKLIIEKDQFGVVAWQDFRNKWVSTRMLEVEVEGKKKTLPFGDASGLLFHRDRVTRESAYKSIYGLFEKDGEIFSTALRNICSDWLNVCERRKYDSPIEASLIANDIEQQTIACLLKTIEDHVAMYQRYLRFKAKQMNLPKLGCHDILGPIPGTPVIRFDYDKARDLVVEAYNRFDEDYAFAAKDMFAKNHVDPSPRLGKSFGAFCRDWYNGKSAFILCNFNGSLIDVYTLAHELGHATHAYYYQRNQTILNGSSESLPMIVAETASVFGELLLTDILLDRAESNKEKEAIICGILDVAGRLIFETANAALFEQSLYDAIKRGEYLDYRTISEYWTEARSRFYADSVEWSKESSARWAMIPHFYFANFRFFNYPYAYAQMFAYALYQKYLEEGKEFVPKFKKMLSAGSSISPMELGKTVDLNVTNSEFWELGLKQYDYLIKELQKIVT
jgi:oligoendopeptidase F